MSQDSSKNKIRQFLRKRGSEEPVISKAGDTPEQTREFIQNKLLTRPSDFYESRRSFYERLQSRFQKTPFFFWKTRRFRTFMTETFPMLAFVSFSCWILWKMEKQFDDMYATMNKRKSLKQVEMERENEEIQKALFEEKFESVPIRDKPKKQIYKFEGFDDDEQDDIAEDWKEEDADINTREGFVELLYDEHLKGKPIPEEFKADVEVYVRKLKDRQARRGGSAFNQRLAREEDDEEEEDES